MIAFVPPSGKALTTENTLQRRAPIRWLNRDEPVNDTDNGWRVFSAIDTGEYLKDGSNWKIVDFNELCMIEPALIGVWDFPVGSRLEFVDDHTKYFIDSLTDQEIPRSRLYIPAQHRK